MTAVHAMGHDLETPPAAPAARPFRVSMLIPGLVQNLAAPIAIFLGLEAAGVSPVWALAGGCAPPLLANLWNWVRMRRIDAAGFLIVASLVSGVVGSLLTGNLGSRIVTDCIVGCVWGVGFGASLLLARPALFYLIRSLVAGSDATRVEAWNGLWRFASFRAAMRFTTATWAAVYFAQVIVEFAASRLAPINTVVALAPLLSAGGTVGLIAFTRLYMHTVRRNLERKENLAWPL
jgi:hypothetical protein